MENKRNQMMKRVVMFVLAVAMVLTTVLIPAPAKAAEAETDVPMVVSSFILKKGEKWEPQVYNVYSDAKISYKIDKKSVATVNKKGVVTAKKPGTAKLTYTVKIGKDTYKGSTKITVKKKLALYEYVKRSNAELNLAYESYCIAMELLGLSDDPTVQENIDTCAYIVEVANDIVKKPSAYSKKDIETELENILNMASFIYDELAPLAEE